MTTLANKRMLCSPYFHYFYLQSILNSTTCLSVKNAWHKRSHHTKPATAPVVNPIVASLSVSWQARKFDLIFSILKWSLTTCRQSFTVSLIFRFAIASTVLLSSDNSTLSKTPTWSKKSYFLFAVSNYLSSNFPS